MASTPPGYGGGWGGPMSQHAMGYSGAGGYYGDGGWGFPMGVGMSQNGMNWGGGGAQATGDPNNMMMGNVPPLQGQVPMGGGMNTNPPQGQQQVPMGNPMQGYGGIGGNTQGAQQQYQSYGWNPQSLPMNWGGPYGPMSWPSYNQMSMNAGGLYGAMFNPWLMLQGGGPNQPPQQGGGTTAPNPTPAPPPIPAPAAPPQQGGLMSPHFAFHATQGTMQDAPGHRMVHNIYRGPSTGNPWTGATV